MLVRTTNTVRKQKTKKPQTNFEENFQNVIQEYCTVTMKLIMLRLILNDKDFICELFLNGPRVQRSGKWNTAKYNFLNKSFSYTCDKNI